ncbi:MAG TPA: hypothetical protein PK200_08750 [Spirochaetota bacterium]|nr:hypothetical protein [Spirochaetota bacterium]HQO01628.1 hypothetical protein [Spirochaetota bacterium]HQP49797.1 hypothetical protein [Spirochaetota bacterium]
MAQCPGTDMRYWSFNDIFEVRCPGCGAMIEFFKDDPSRVCHHCGEVIRNSRLQKGCAEWCPMAGSCAEAHRNDKK